MVPSDVAIQSVRIFGEFIALTRETNNIKINIGYVHKKKKKLL